MISLKIGSSERQNSDITKRWIAQEIERRQKANQPICVELQINKNAINLFLNSGACSNGSGGGGRKPNRSEMKIIKLWNQKGLNGNTINPGMLISFLEQYDRYC